MDNIDQILLAIIKISGFIAVALIVILVGAKSVVDAIMALGFNVPWISPKIKQLEINNIKAILSEFTHNIPSLLKFLRSEEAHKKKMMPQHQQTKQEENKKKKANQCQVQIRKRKLPCLNLA